MDHGSARAAASFGRAGQLLKVVGCVRKLACRDGLIGMNQQRRDISLRKTTQRAVKSSTHIPSSLTLTDGLAASRGETALHISTGRAIRVAELGAIGAELARQFQASFIGWRFDTSAKNEEAGMCDHAVHGAQPRGLGFVISKQDLADFDECKAILAQCRQEILRPD